MSEHTTPDVRLADRVNFWRDIHCAAMALYHVQQLGQPLDVELPEIQAYDAMCVLHALSHAWLEKLGVESYPHCSAGDGISVLVDEHFVVELLASK